jgi:mRNA interferase YafQ
MSLDIIWTAQFKRDYKLAQKRRKDIRLLDDCIRLLAKSQELPVSFRDHELTGRWAGSRECHIQPDWLLIYRIEGNDMVLVLSRTGTHSDLFTR